MPLTRKITVDYDDESCADFQAQERFAGKIIDMEALAWATISSH